MYRVGIRFIGFVCHRVTNTCIVRLIVEKAILVSDLGLTHINYLNTFRLVFLEFTEDRRYELAKDIKKKGDNAKVAIRNIRRDANDAIKKENKAGDISDDEAKNSEDEIQKIVDVAIAQTGASTIKDMGKVMGIVTAKAKGRADMKIVGGLVKKMLQGK